MFKSQANGTPKLNIDCSMAQRLGRSSGLRGCVNCGTDRIPRARPQMEMALMSENLPTGKDRRIRQRFKINVPVTSLIGDREVPAYTRDLSNRGVFFYLYFTEDAQIDGDFEFMVDLPPEVTLSTICRIQCRGRVVRIEESATNFTGIAAEILEYSILRGCD